LNRGWNGEDLLMECHAGRGSPGRRCAAVTSAVW